MCVVRVRVCACVCVCVNLEETHRNRHIFHKQAVQIGDQLLGGKEKRPRFCTKKTSKLVSFWVTFGQRTFGKTRPVYLLMSKDAEGRVLQLDIVCCSVSQYQMAYALQCVAVCCSIK